MKKKRICIFTGTRAEYGLLKPLIDELKKEASFELQLLITGMHLSPEFGLTVNEIETDQFSKVEKVEILLSSDTSVGISKAIGLGVISFAEAFDRQKPDLFIGLGDRFELFSAVSAALVSKVPVAHIHGGEVTSGAYDEAFRHSITKMSHLHFATTEQYRKRVIQLGEKPNTVFNVGALGIDNITNMKFLTLEQLEDSMNFKLDKKFFVVTFHPVTLEDNTAKKQTYKLLEALDYFDEYKIIFTKANADNSGRIINKLIDDFVQNNSERAIAFESLGQLRYLSAISHAEIIIGNSSSGLIEVPAFKKPTINIGARQKGRISAKSVIDCKPEKEDIIDSIKFALSKEFVERCKNVTNPYGRGDTAKQITDKLLAVNYAKLVHKEFFDVNFNYD